MPDNLTFTPDQWKIIQDAAKVNYRFPLLFNPIKDKIKKAVKDLISLKSKKLLRHNTDQHSVINEVKK